MTTTWVWRMVTRTGRWFKVTLSKRSGVFIIRVPIRRRKHQNRKSLGEEVTLGIPTRGTLSIEEALAEPIEQVKAKGLAGVDGFQTWFPETLFVVERRS